VCRADERHCRGDSDRAAQLGAAIAGINYELDAIAATVIGGTSLMGGEGTLGGTLVGALIMGVLRNGLNLLGVSSFLQQIVIGRRDRGRRAARYRVEKEASNVARSR